MSTLPHDASSRTDSAPLVTTQYTEQDFDAVVREFEAVTDEVGMAKPPATILRDLCRQVADVSHDVFGGEVRITVGRDWEVADWIYFVVDVCAPEDPDEFLARVKEWDVAMHRNVGSQAHLFCLSFDLA
jgi:hypothetical protein